MVIYGYTALIKLIFWLIDTKSNGYWSSNYSNECNTVRSVLSVAIESVVRYLCLVDIDGSNCIQENITVMG